MICPTCLPVPVPTEAAPTWCVAETIASVLSIRARSGGGRTRSVAQQRSEGMTPGGARSVTGFWRIIHNVPTVVMPLPRSPITLYESVMVAVMIRATCLRCANHVTPPFTLKAPRAGHDEDRIYQKLQEREGGRNLYTHLAK